MVLCLFPSEPTQFVRILVGFFLIDSKDFPFIGPNFSLFWTPKYLYVKSLAEEIYKANRQWGSQMMKTAIIDETWLKFQPMHIVRITKKTHQLSRQMFQKSSIFLTKTFQMTFDYNVILMLHAQCKFHSFAVSCKHKPQYVMALTILQCQRRQRSKLYCSCLSIQSVWRVGFFTRSVCSRLCGRIKVFVKHTHNSISRLFSLLIICLNLVFLLMRTYEIMFAVILMHIIWINRITKHSKHYFQLNEIYWSSQLSSQQNKPDWSHK